MRLVIFNLKHGSNLGDRLISECIEAELKSIAPHVEVRTLDLAGRDAPPPAGSRRKLAFLILNLLPKPIRAALAEYMLRRLSSGTLAPKWGEVLQGADAIVVGGGGIFADSDLNFPIKIGTALEQAASLDLPVAIYAVGVTRSWSKRGEAILGGALAATRLAFAAVRDEPSRAFWQSHFAKFNIGDAQIALDPALLTARHFPVQPMARITPRVGLCITSPEALAYHGGKGIDAKAIEARYVELAKALKAAGRDVALFTTGMPEDIAFQGHLTSGPLRDTFGDRMAPTFNSAGEMVAFIANCDVVVAHRLHAIVPAFAYGIPGVALGWDEKLVGQCAIMGCGDRLFDLIETPTQTIVAAANAAMEAKVDLARRESLVNEASDGLQRLIKSLTTTSLRHAS